MIVRHVSKLVVRRDSVQVNQSKTTIVPFIKKKALTALCRLTWGNVQLRTSASVRQLGVILDQRLMWNAHLEIMIHKVKWVLVMSRLLMGTTRGLKSYICFMAL